MAPIDEDADLRASLAALGPGALADLRRVLEGSGDSVVCSGVSGSGGSHAAFAVLRYQP
jgi:hypothetical protein